jgi:hypothetical protein
MPWHCLLGLHIVIDITFIKTFNCLFMLLTFFIYVFVIVLFYDILLEKNTFDFFKFYNDLKKLSNIYQYQHHINNKLFA